MPKKGERVPIAVRLERCSIPEPNSGCRLWTSSVDGGGYGLVEHEGKTRKAHRVAWSDKHGPIPPGKHVCHKCDVRSCIEDNHLFLGTNADNMADKARKGRCRTGSIGERHHSAKLTEDLVRSIRADTRPSGLLAELYGVTDTSIIRVRSGETWRHVKADERVEGAA